MRRGTRRLMRFGGVMVLGWWLAAVTAGPSIPDASAEETPGAVPRYNAAVKLHNLGSWDLAAEEWQGFLRDFPQDGRAARARYYLGVCLFQLKRYEPAAEAFEAAEKAPQLDADLRESALLYEGASLLESGREGKAERLPQAAAALDRYLAAYPQGKLRAEAVFYRAECDYLLGKKTEAVAGYRRFLQDFGGHELAPNVMYALAFAAEETGDRETAAQYYRQFLEKYPSHALVGEVRIRLGEVLYASGQFEQARQSFAEAAKDKNTPAADEARIREGDCLVQLKQYDAAAAIYASLNKEFPQSRLASRAELAAGKCWYLAGRYDQSLPLLQKSAAIPELRAEALHWIARVLLKQNQPEKVVELLTDAELQAAPEAARPVLHMDRGDALYEMPNRRADSIAEYRAAAENPDANAAAEALYAAAYAALQVEDASQAWQLTQEFLRRFARHPLTPEVLHIAAESRLLETKYDEAAGLYDDLLKQFGSHPQAVAWRLRQLLARQLSGKHDAVIATLTPLVNQWTRPEDLAAAFVLLGRSQLELGKVQEAVESFLQALAKVPNAPPADEAMLLLASAYRRLDRTADARTVLEKMLAQFPNSPLVNRARFRLGEYCFALGDFGAAEKAYRAVIQSPAAGTLVPSAMYELACTLVKQDRARDAEQLLAELLAKQPDEETAAKARYVRAVALRKLGKPAEAVQELQAALQGNLGKLDRADALYTLGLLRIDLKQYAEAAKTFATLSKDHADYPDADRALYQWAWALKLAGRNDEAVDMFRKLIAQFPNSEHAPEARYHSGEAFYKSGDYIEAAKEFHKTVQAAGQSELGEKASHRLGWAYYQMKQYDNAQKTFAYQRATYPSGPLAADAQFMEAESLFQLGKYSEALAAYEKLPPPAADGFRVLQRLHAGQSAAQLKQWDKAVTLLSQCLKDDPNAPEAAEVLYELGNVYRNRGDNAKALEYFSQAAARSQGVTGAKAQFMIGELQFLEKKYDEAVKSFFRVAYGFDSPELAKVQADATFEAALCLELLKKPQQAAQLYRELLEKFPQSDKVKDAQAKLDGLTRQ